MKKIIVMQGAPGSGKSFLVKRLGLENHHVSRDAFRRLLAGVQLDANGNLSISAREEEWVNSLFLKSISARMVHGDTLIVEQTVCDKEFWDFLLPQAKDMRYEVVFVDFSTLPIERVLAQNRGRSDLLQVPEEAVRRIYKKNDTNRSLQAQWYAHQIKERLEVNTSDALEQVAKKLECFLTPPVLDLSKYEKVVHIGDIHGSLSVLKEALGGEFKEQWCYVFVGDLVDRGKENGILLDWLLPRVVGKDNIHLVWGNHEEHLLRYAQGKKAHSREFEKNTKEQLDRAKVNKEQLEAWLLKAPEILLYQYGAEKVVVTHGGISGLPLVRSSVGELALRWDYLSSQDIVKGIGNYDTDIDRLWSESVRQKGSNWVQVHGHRNKKEIAINAYEQSWCLEQKVEFGGHLAVVELTANGWSPFLYKNNVYYSWAERFGAKQREKMGITMSEKTMSVDGLPIPSWILESGEGKVLGLTKEELERMQAHEGVIEKKMPAPYEHICSLNFSRTVFFEKSWDDVVVKARGLFYEKETGHIVSRGYDKFFNIGEVAQTQMEHLVETLKFPIHCYVKENGFLGNLGYDEKTDSLFYATKSTTGGDFAKWFEQIAKKQFGSQAEKKLKEYLRNAHACAVFEVIDTVNDPHMIEYAQSKVVLLDVFARDSETKKLPYEQLRTLGHTLGIEVKERAIVFNTKEAFEGWYKKCKSDLGYKYKGSHLEGFVIEDGQGFQTKIKLPYYSFWKKMRGAKDRLYSLREAQSVLEGEEKRGSKRNVEKSALLEEKIEIWKRKVMRGHPLEEQLCHWLLSQPKDILKQDIIRVRHQFESQTPNVETLYAQNWDYEEQMGVVKHEPIKNARKPLGR